MSLSARIFLLIFGILSFYVVFDVYETFRARDREQTELLLQASNQAHISALDLGRIFEGARQVLRTLSNVPALRAHDRDACNVLLRATVADLPMYQYIAVDGINGEIVCGNYGSAPRGTAEQQPIDAAIASGDFVVGHYGLSKLSGAQIVHLGYPLLGHDGSVEGVLVAGVNLAWLNATVAQWGLPTGTAVSIADRNGIILARYPKAELPGQPISANLRGPTEAWIPGAFASIDSDGIARVYGYRPVEIGRSGGVFLAVGLDSSAASAGFERALRRNLALFVALLLPAALLSWVYVRRYIARPIKQLVGAAARWQDGDWAARVKSGGGIVEFDRLAEAFDTMVGTLAAREGSLKQAAASLRHSQEHLARAQRVALIGSFEIDLATLQIESSDETYRIFGLSRDTGPLTAAMVEAMVLPEDREIMKRAFADARAGSRGKMPEYRIRRPDGVIRTLYREVDEVRDGDGTLIRVIGVIKDITELREAERQRDEFQSRFLQAQKLEAIGTLAGGIAHDLNNVLMPVIALSTLTMGHLPSASRDYENLKIIHQAGERARDLVRRILAFARKGQPERQCIAVEALVTATLRLLQSTLPATISICEHIEPVPLVWADEGQLAQVVMNLVTNAAQAIGDRMGTITIEVAPASNPASTGSRRGVRLSVIDTGCGIDDAIRQRIFEPFFTTKAVNEGTGLGLSVVHGIVTDHGGSISVSSSPAQGTRFDVFIPIPDSAELTPETQVA